MSTMKLTRMAHWVKKARNTIELFNRCLKNGDAEMVEARIAIVDVLGKQSEGIFTTLLTPTIESVLQILGESLKYLRQCPSGTSNFIF